MITSGERYCLVWISGVKWWWVQHPFPISQILTYTFSSSLGPLSFFPSSVFCLWTSSSSSSKRPPILSFVMPLSMLPFLTCLPLFPFTCCYWFKWVLISFITLSALWVPLATALISSFFCSSPSNLLSVSPPFFFSSLFFFFCCFFFWFFLCFAVRASCYLGSSVPLVSTSILAAA